MARHRDLVDPDLHEPKGFTTVPLPATGQVYVTDGLGSGYLAPLASATNRTVISVRTLVGASTTLSAYDCAVELVKLIGTPGGTPTVYLPNTQRPIWFWNTTGVAVKLATAAGAFVTIADTKKALVFCDGTDCLRLAADI